jgi:SAM-dependent methyltransferase
MRELVGRTELASFENPTGAPIWDGLPEEAWATYLDFGCGCGRSARRLMLQTPRPKRYIGVDIHRGMVQWCRENLTPIAPGFEFHEHHVFSPGLNPDRTLPWAAPLPAEDGSCTLIEATSVFTHLIESQAEFYLDEVARVLAPEGILIATFFLFEKAGFPFMQDNQHALYINSVDPTNAVVFDRDWLLAGLAARDLVLCKGRRRSSAASTGSSTSRAPAPGSRRSSCRRTTRRSATARRRCCASARSASASTPARLRSPLTAPRARRSRRWTRSPSSSPARRSTSRRSSTRSPSAPRRRRCPSPHPATTRWPPSGAA